MSSNCAILLMIGLAAMTGFHSAVLVALAWLGYRLTVGAKARELARWERLIQIAEISSGTIEEMTSELRKK